MALNIKNPEAHALANELAELTGMSITAAGIEALRQQVAHYQQAPKEQQRLADELMLIRQRCAAHLQQPAKSTEHGDLLYGKIGLPV